MEYGKSCTCSGLFARARLRYFVSFYAASLTFVSAKHVFSNLRITFGHIPRQALTRGKVINHLPGEAGIL